MKYAQAFQEMKRRGFIQQVTELEPLQELLAREPVTFYVGIDPTADSLHVGHLMAVMGMMQMQKFGHRPIAIVGGGTAMVGDPSGKSEMRKMLTREAIAANSEKIKQQLSRYLDFTPGKALMVDNYEWLGELKYIEFLRDIGRHFSVNRMLTYEAYKIRMEKGLSFLEFNYQLLQAYDYLMLYDQHGCRLQMGGDDQWANILAGTDLIRRVRGAECYGLTFPLLTTATGAKMGKTESGAVWLDPAKTTPYDYFQYWVNCDDRDVSRFLAFFTPLPMEEIEVVAGLEGAALNAAKVVLAFEATALTHGREAAQTAQAAAAAAFGKREIPASMLPSSKVERGGTAAGSMPGGPLAAARLAAEPRLADLLVELGLLPSKGEAKRLIQGGGVTVNDQRVEDIQAALTPAQVVDGRIVLRLGKKRWYQLVISQ
ncbi:MAG TPA: tyrosine--tRNA ligase [bacterium]|nr:tyrosine--tRNA ligase [bacterium]HPR88463.1 tyrosine--tRNA ligase [bacterium]